MDESKPSEQAAWLENSAEQDTAGVDSLSEPVDTPSPDPTPLAPESAEGPNPAERAAVAAALAEETLPVESEESRPAEKYTVKLEAFEGPLDLLLYLIRREEINIWDIPIARITAQYLEYIQIMQDLSLNIAGEFLVMAATLIFIKSKMLLPPDPNQAVEGMAEEEDPRHELVYQLLEHQKFKNAAQMLYAKESVESEVWSKPPREFIEEGEEMVTVTLFDLVRAYRDVVQRFTERITLEYHREEITIEEKIAEIRNRLLVHNRILFSALFESGGTRAAMVVTFLAVLELVRLGEIQLWQDRSFAEIFLQRSAREQTMEMGLIARWF